MVKSSFCHSHCNFANILVQNPSFALEFRRSIVGGTSIDSTNRLRQWGKLLVLYLFMVQFFIFIGKIHVFELVLGVKIALSHSRRWATWDLREWIILAGDPKGTCENLALCLKGTCENHKVEKKIKVLLNEKDTKCWIELLTFFLCFLCRYLAITMVLEWHEREHE